MKKIKLTLSILLTFLLIFVIVGCGDSQAEIYNNYIDDISGTTLEGDVARAGEPLSGKLTIYGNGTNTMFWYKYWIEEFNKIYPNVKIELIGPELFVDIDEFTQQTTVLLLSGESADIINLDGLPYMSYAKSGIFTNLYTFMDKDTTFEKENYYTNIFEAIRI